MPEILVLVDQDDNEIGFEEKLEAHRGGGKLHRAFSVFVYNSAGDLLLQRRARDKYHSGGLWSNTCCGHPRPGESTADAAHRRLAEEMGFDTDLSEITSLSYRAPLDDDLIEHEYLHVFAGRYDGEVLPDPTEAAEWRWIDANELADRVSKSADEFTKWFVMALPLVEKARH